MFSFIFFCLLFFQTREMQPRRTSALAPNDWNATIGNFATFSAFIYSAVLQITFLGGSEIAVLVLAPVLLLLNRDVTSRWLRHLNESNRYFPIVFTISGVLVGYSLKRVFLPSFLPLCILSNYLTSFLPPSFFFLFF